MILAKKVTLIRAMFESDVMAHAVIYSGDGRVLLKKSFQPFAQYPFFIDRALKRAHTWADKMMVVVERHNLDGSESAKEKQKSDMTVLHTAAPMFTNHSDKPAFVKMNDRPVDRPEQHTFDGATALTVSAITGSAGVGAAVGIVSGADIVDSVVGGVAGDFINSAFGDD